MAIWWHYQCTTHGRSGTTATNAGGLLLQNVERRGEPGISGQGWGGAKQREEWIPVHWLVMLLPFLLSSAPEKWLVHIQEEPLGQRRVKEQKFLRN